jgi:hypothetical protein
MSKETDSQIIRTFFHRYKKISNDSGYELVYKTLALIREIIPCREVGISIAQIRDNSLKSVSPGTVPLTVATPLMVRTRKIFFQMFDNIDFAKKFATAAVQTLSAGDFVEPHSFDDDPSHSKGIIHQFYHYMGVSDVVMVAGLVDRHQFVFSPVTQSYYFAYSCMAREKESKFSFQEKQLYALFFDIFLEDFRRKIRCADESRFLPYLTGEKMGSLVDFSLFERGVKLKPRELATIRACFDLKQQKVKVSQKSLASHLHLRGKNDCSVKQLERASGYVDYDFRKIKLHLFKNLSSDQEWGSAELNDIIQNDFKLEQMSDVFKTYAYFGLYPDSSGQFLSHLSNRLGDKYF